MISERAYDLMKRLLNQNFKERLGAKDVDDIKNHPFFEGIDWENIKQQAPPFTPNTKSLEEIQTLEEDEGLRREILNMRPQEVKKPNALHKMKLEKFVRYDLLKSQTIESAGKTIIKKGATLKKLKSIAEDFTTPHLDISLNSTRHSERLHIKVLDYDQ